MKKFIVLFLFIFSASAFAQEKIDTVQIINNGTLNMEIDNRINSVLKAKKMLYVRILLLLRKIQRKNLLL